MSWLYVFLSVLISIAGYFFSKYASRERYASKGAHDGAGGAMGEAAASNHSTNDKSVLILFGSQTGTAEMFAKTLAREGTKLGISIKLQDVQFFNSADLQYEKLVILVCATYGEGEPTDTMKAFHDWMMEETSAESKELASVKYTIFGLGDREYKYFCNEAIVMDRRFTELGAERVYGIGLGDTGSGQLEEEFDEWRSALWPVVSRVLHASIKTDTEESVEQECRMKYWDGAEQSLAFPKIASILEPSQRFPLWLPILRNEELLKVTTERSIRLIELDISNTTLSYQAGDHLGILPCNPDSVVEDYLRILNVSEDDAQKVFSLQNKVTLKNVFPARVTTRTALKWYVDLTGPPKKFTLRAFAQCCTDPSEKQELLRVLCVTPEAQKEFAKLSAQLRCVYGFLCKFKSAKVSLDFFFEFMPRITPRFFSISTDILAMPTTVGITVSVVKDGLCTNMLLNMDVGDRVPIFVRKSNFNLPLRAKERPVIMIGPGTGVAPFIGFLHRRRIWKQRGVELGKALLFFGCHRRSEDHIYEELCAQALHDGILSSLFVAYSRDQPEKVYVQHHIQSNSAEVWELIHKLGGNVYICGDAKHMARDVEAELLGVIQKEGAMTFDEAAKYLRQLEEEKRYLKDVW